MMTLMRTLLAPDHRGVGPAWITRGVVPTIMLLAFLLLVGLIGGAVGE